VAVFEPNANVHLPARSTLGVDFVGENVFAISFVDCLVKPREQLNQSLALATDKHGEGVVIIVGNGDAPDGPQHFNADFPMGNQLRDIRER